MLSVAEPCGVLGSLYFSCKTFLQNSNCFFMVVYLLSSIFLSLCRYLISSFSSCQSSLCVSRPILYCINLILLATSLLESLFRTVLSSWQHLCHCCGGFLAFCLCLGFLCSLCWTPFSFLALHLHFGRIHPTVVSCRMASRGPFLSSCISKMFYRDWQTRASRCSMAWCLLCGSKS